MSLQDILKKARQESANKAPLPGVVAADEVIELGNTTAALLGPPKPRTDLIPLAVSQSHGDFTITRVIIHNPPSESTE